MQRLKDSAIQAAWESGEGDFRHGCAILLGGSIISMAGNQFGTFSHAEMIAVKKLCKKGA